jgi:DNA-directed RNA polymerase specialized sigma24 family protein
MDQNTEDVRQPLQSMLRWLDPNSERAGHKYEEIRARLIFIFRCRGCTFPDDLADKCFDRVASIISRPGFTYEGDPALFFYGVAKLVIKEHLRTRLFARIEVEGDLPKTKEDQSQCLEKCMSKLPARNAQLILDYYGQQEGSKTAHRKGLAGRLGMPLNALRIQTYRIRAVLRQCVLQCIESKIE